MEIVSSGRGSSERRRRDHNFLLTDRNRADGRRTDAVVLEAGKATVERLRRGLSRRIPDRDTLCREISARLRKRNAGPVK